MRIISGKLKGRKLLESSDLKLRPTSDRNREALFSILTSARFLYEIDFDLASSNFLDLCCGTGAVAFEALSRGAKSAFLIDKNPAHLEIAKKNARSFLLEKEVEFLLADANKLPIAKVRFDAVFIDPPYEMKVDEMLQSLTKNNWIDEKTLIMIESKNKQDFPDLKQLDLRKYGKSFFGFYVLR